ncbi:MAG: hypothetical protein R3F19_23550 [Verrucomicrobiales bacterium]
MKTETILIKLEQIQEMLAACPTSLEQINDIEGITQTLGAIHTILNSARHLQDLARDSHLQIARQIAAK